MIFCCLVLFCDRQENSFAEKRFVLLLLFFFFFFCLTEVSFNQFKSMKKKSFLKRLQIVPVFLQANIGTLLLF